VSILGSYYAVGLTIAGLSFGLLIGVSPVSSASSLCRIAHGAGAIVVVAVAQFFPDWSRVFIVAGVVMFGQFLEGNVLAPKLVGHSVGLHPVWLISRCSPSLPVRIRRLLLPCRLLRQPGADRFALRRYLASPYYTGNRPT